MDEDDEFLYGTTRSDPPEIPGLSLPPSDKTTSANGVSEHSGPEAQPDVVEGIDEVETGEEQAEGDDSDDDIEIIIDPTPRSLDFRQNPPGRPPANRTTSSAINTPTKAAQPSLTTEYTPHERGGLSGIPKSTPTAYTQSTPQSSLFPHPGPSLSSSGSEPHTQDQGLEDGQDPSTLPAAAAPPSHPAINPSLTGTLDGRPILEVDLGAMTEKAWRRPGSDISDWFNYGFDEISWEAYCYRRRDLGDLASVLKTNVLNFAGMPEDQLSALPPEVRQMVMTGATAMMSTGGPNPMMGPGVGMNPMMDMSGMGPMNMGAMGMGMNGDMQMQMQPGGPMMQDGSIPVSVPGGPVGSNGTPEQAVQMGMPDGYGPGGPGAAMMGMNMGGDYGMQDPNPMSMGPQMYQSMEGNVTPNPAGRGGAPVAYRGRGMAQGMGMRGRGGFPSRGRGGRGGLYAGADGVPPPLPVRPASPLPPGVPTGPRNQNKYKDRDGNAPAVDGLDYGGNKDGGGRTPSGEPEERSSSRKRRSSPILDDGRGAKRR